MRLFISLYDFFELELSAVNAEAFGLAEEFDLTAAAARATDAGRTLGRYNRAGVQTVGPLG